MNKLSKFIREYESDDILRLHTPGHQARCEFINKISSHFDITEIDGADSLYHSNGVIKDLEDQISELYQAQSVISAGGSTLCIQTMISLFKDRTFVAMRSSHVSFYNICTLLDIQPEWINIDNESLYKNIPKPCDVEKILVKIKKPSLVYITSPNYYGVGADIKGISEVCKKYGAVLIVDNAHGSHLKFTTMDDHPISLGADMCCDSFHKTLPTLTGAAVLHSKLGLFNKMDVKYHMSIFGSTSPSYLIMDSIGLCVDWIKIKGRECFKQLEKRRKSLIENLPLNFLQTDCSKITIDCINVKNGVLGVRTLLRQHKIEPEYTDNRCVTLIISPFLSDMDWNRLRRCLEKVEIENKNSITSFEKRKLSVPIVKLRLNKAFRSNFEQIDVKCSIGRICGKSQWMCPPGIPIVAAGELITEDIADLLMKNNVNVVYVIKDL